MTTNQSEADCWDILAEPSRRLILSELAQRPRAVGELAESLPITRPAVSQHLRVMKDAGLVVDETVGTRRIYRLDALGVAAFRDQLDTFWKRTLAGFADEVSPPPDPGGTR